MFFIVDNLLLSLACFKYPEKLTSAIVASTASIVITIINSTRVNHLIFCFISYY